MTRRLIALFLLLLGSGSLAMAKEPASVTAQLRQADALRARSRELLDDAANAYRAVLEREPQNLEAERGLGRVLRDSGAVEQALPYLRDAAKRSDDAADYARLGWALFRAGEWAEAEEAFGSARRRGKQDAETVRGSALAKSAARAARPPERRESTAAVTTVGGWQSAGKTLFNATGFVADVVEKLLLGLIALLVAGGLVTRVWGTLMGRTPPVTEPGMRFAQWQGLPVREIATGRILGRVRRVLFDPQQARAVGVQTGSAWRWRVAPLTAARGIGPEGLLVADADALVKGDAAPELRTLALAGAQPLGACTGRKRVVTEEGTLVGYARPDRLWIDGATGKVTFAVTPSRYHEAWQGAFKVLDFLGLVNWLMSSLLDRGLALLPGRLSAQVRLPLDLVLSANKDLVIVSTETAAWIERHFEELEADAKARLAQVRDGVEKARPHLERVRDLSVEKARPHLERARVARAAGVGLARRSAEAVLTRGQTSGGANGEATSNIGGGETQQKSA